MVLGRSSRPAGNSYIYFQPSISVLCPGIINHIESIGEMSIRYLSVCSGIEAATVAWHHLGWTPTAFAEVEPFPAAVLQYHYPNVINHGDIKKFKEWSDEKIDVLVGGTPCQSFSIAGLRKGLEDPRGNLMLTYLAIVGRYQPRWVVWENVPGVMSSGGGRDFGTFLGALGKLGYGWAYRILDSQWFGVPQRRRRVFVVGCFGNWECAAKVLFESESLSRNIMPVRKKEQDITANIANGLRNSGIDADQLVDENFKIDGTMQFTKVNKPIAYSLDSLSSNSMKSKNPVSGCNEVDLSKALDTSRGLDPSCNQGGMAVVHSVVAIDLYNGTITRNVAVPLTNRADGTGTGSTVMQSNAVRRLTPIECERLQGFSDGYTAIPWRKKPASECPDGPRYKALGNSMAVPVMRWIGERITKATSSA